MALNGSGKTTLLLVLQELLPYRGSVERTGRCAGVFAQPAVLRGSVLWNVEVVARAAIGLNERAAEEKAKTMLSSVGLTGAMHLDARKLSSGQRQRLALARALVVEPQILFLDEPFSSVDADGRPALRKLIGEFVSQTGCTLVLATQNLADVVGLCKTTVLLEAGLAVSWLDATAIGTSRHPYLQALVAEFQLHIAP